MPAPKSPNFPGQREGHLVFMGRTSFVTPPSVHLQQKGYEYLEEIEQDTHVDGQFKLRFRAAVKPGYQIEAASTSKLDREVRDHVQRSFDSIEDTFIVALEKIHDAVRKGFALLEPQFALDRDRGLYNLSNLRHIPAKFVRFDFDTSGKVAPNGVVLYDQSSYRWDKKSQSGQRFNYADFIHAKYGPTDNPYGNSTTLKVAKWNWIKNEVGKMWPYYAETFGAPVIKVKYGQTSQAKTDSSSDEALAQQILRDVRAFGGVGLPRGFELEFLEAVRSGDPPYEALMVFCNKEISKEIVGATLATEAGGKNSGASYALGSQHGGVAETFSYIDALWLEYIVNIKIIPRLVNLNFNTRNYPKFRLLEDNYARLIGAAQSLQILQQMGLEIDRDWLHDWIGVPQPSKDSKTLIPAAPTQPAAPKSANGLDKNLRRASRSEGSSFILHPSSFASDPLSDLRQPESRTNKIDQIASAAIFAFLRDVVDKFTQTLKSGATPGVRPAEALPPPNLNMGALKRILMASGLLYYLTGKAEAGEQVRAAGYELPDGDPNPQLPQAFKPKTEIEKPFELAATIAAFKSFFPIRQPELNTLSALYDTKFFNIAGLVRADMEKIWSNQVLALRDGWSLREFEQAVRREVIRYAGDVYGLDTTGQPLLARHLELIYRNGMNTGFADGIDSMATDPDIAEFLFGFKYLAIEDDRVRADHIELDGITLPTDHEFWQNRTPPWDHNCRCTRQLIFQDQIDSESEKQTPESQIPPYDFLPDSGFVR